jgi:hypothetical protein
MKAVVSVLISFSILSACRDAEGQRKPQDAYSEDHRVLAGMLANLKTQANEAHEAGQIDQEISFRQQFSRKAWEIAVDPTSLDKYDRYLIIFENDLPLALLLEGTHQWPEAEARFRHNQTELAANRVAGNDIKSENQLQLAYLLAREGKSEDANRICSYWKGRMKHLAAGQDTGHIYGIPVAPIRDTPEVEVAEWDLACGKPKEGVALLMEQIAAHPHMLFPFTVLSNYYFAQGDFQKARTAESDGTAALIGR